VLCLCACGHSLFAQDIDGGSRKLEAVLENPAGAATIGRELVQAATKECTSDNAHLLADDLAVVPVISSVRDVVSLQYRCTKEPGEATSPASPSPVPLHPVTSDTIFGWDMTYGAAFDGAGVSGRDTMRKYFRDSWFKAPYLEKAILDVALFEDLPAQVSAAYVIDYQAFFYFGHRATGLTFAASDRAGSRAWNSRQRRVEVRPLDPDAVRRQAEALMTFAPSARPFERPVAVKGAEENEFVTSGYVGVASVYLDGRMRQFPLTENDVLQVIGPRETRPGRLMRALELAAMTESDRKQAVSDDMRWERAQPLLEAVRAGDVDAIRAAVKHGADVNMEIADTTPLLEATKTNQVESVRTLLKLGANSNQMVSRMAPLQIAAGRELLDMVKLLVESGADPNVESGPDRPLNAAIAWGRIETVRYLVERGARVNPPSKPDYQEPPLFKALHYWSSLEMIRLLIAHGADVNAVHQERTPLMELATGVGLIERLMAEHRGDELISALIDAGADINRTTSKCWTALSWSRHMSKRDIEAALLRFGADPEVSKRCEQGQAEIKRASAKQLTANGIESVSSAGVHALVQQATQPVLVHYFADWAAPAVQQRAFLTSAGKSFEGRLRIIEVDMSDEQRPDDRYRIDGIPTLLLFKNHTVVARKAGFVSAAETTKWLKENLPVLKSRR
jgi:ankyrin repeat protein